MQLLETVILKPQPTLRLHAKPLLQRISVLSVNFHAWEAALHIFSSFSTPDNNAHQEKERMLCKSAEVINTSTPLQQQDTSDLHLWKEGWADMQISLNYLSLWKNQAKNGWQLEGEVISQSNHWAVERSDCHSPSIADYKENKALKFQMAAFWQGL